MVTCGVNRHVQGGFKSMAACMLEQRISVLGRLRRKSLEIGSRSAKGKRLWEMLSLSLKGTRLELVLLKAMS